MSDKIVFLELWEENDCFFMKCFDEKPKEISSDFYYKLKTLGEKKVVKLLLDYLKEKGDDDED